MRYGNKVCVGYFAGRCRTNITALIHRQVLELQLSCLGKSVQRWENSPRSLRAVPVLSKSRSRP